MNNIEPEQIAHETVRTALRDHWRKFAFLGLAEGAVLAFTGMGAFKLLAAFIVGLIGYVAIGRWELRVNIPRLRRAALARLIQERDDLVITTPILGRVVPSSGPAITELFILIAYRITNTRVQDGWLLAHPDRRGPLCFYFALPDMPTKDDLCLKMSSTEEKATVILPKKGKRPETIWPWELSQAILSPEVTTLLRKLVMPGIVSSGKVELTFGPESEGMCIELTIHGIPDEDWKLDVNHVMRLVQDLFTP